MSVAHALQAIKGKISFARRDVTQALMQQRLEGLQAALAACPASSDQDAWSSSEESAGPDEAAAVAIDAPAPARALVETERERNIRMGLITPFDNVAGASRRVRRDALPPGLTPAPLLAPSSHGAKLSAMAKRLTQRRREQERAREAVIEMAPEDLDEDMLQFVQKQVLSILNTLTVCIDLFFESNSPIR
jgi:hypothetical protein